MASREVSDLVGEIHSRPEAVSLVVTGAGTRALAWLLGEAGASRTVIDAQVPYARPALDEYVGSSAGQHVSAGEAIKIAEAAYWRGLRLNALARPGEIGGRPVLGLGCTAAVATDRPKRGEHRAHVAVRAAGCQSVLSLILDKGARDRDGEEEVVSRMVVNALARACGIERELPLDLQPSETVQTTGGRVDDPLSSVVSSESSLVTVERDGRQSRDAPVGAAVLAGSFNPLHEGHRRLADVAREMTGRRAVFEISVTNVEKPPLELAQLEARIAQFRGNATVVVTRAPTFVEKSALLRDAIFVVGHDTAARLFDDRFYPPHDSASDPEGVGTASSAAMARVRGNGGSFLVAGRGERDRFLTLADLAVPEGFEEMLRPIPEDRFRIDTSSSEIRRNR